MPGLQTIDLNSQGITSKEAFGVDLINVKPLHTSGIPSGESFGSHTLEYGQTISLIGIPSGETIGRAQIIPGLAVIDLAGDGIPSTEAFGYPSVPQAILLNGISSEEAFGTPFIQGIPANWSVKYLPPHNQVQSLYDLLICPCIDFVMLQDFVRFHPKPDQDILDQAHELLVSGDDEALLAYFRTLIKPIIGTYRVIKLIISFAGYSDQTILYWYQYGGNFLGQGSYSSLCGGNIVSPQRRANGQDFYFKVVAGAIAGSTFPPISPDPPSRVQNLITTLDASYNALTNFIVEYKNERSTLESLKLAVTFYIGGPYIGDVILAGEKVEIYDRSISGQITLDERGSVWQIPVTFPC